MEEQRKSILEKMDMLIQTIYSPDQTEIDKKFLDFLESLDDYVKVIGKNEDSIYNILKQIELAYSIKDYIALSDFILYGLKPQILGTV